MSTKEKNHKIFIQKAIEVGKTGVLEEKGGPFGCVIVRDNQIIAEGCNQVTSTDDPTAHAEVVAIRNACKKLGSFQLDDCIIYTSCEPCPMCLGAIYWARPKAVYYACTKQDAADVDFDDDFIYKELAKDHNDRKIPFYNIGRIEGKTLFELWRHKEDKTQY